MQLPKLFRLSFILCIGVFTQTSLFAQKADFEENLQQLIKKHEAVGLSIVVVKKGKPIFNKSYGFKDLENQIALNNTDLFRIASISKSFSATTIMQLVEQGKLKLSDDFSDLVGFKVRNPNYPNTIITLEMVLSHRSSINDSNGYFTFDVLDPTKNPKWEKSYNNYEPGSQYEYCNLNFNMVGAVIERVSGERFDLYVKKQVLDPLGLKAGFCVDSLDKNRFVKLYDRSTGTYEEQPAAYNPRSEEVRNHVLGKTTPIFSPTGGLKISANDLATYMLMHMNYGKLGKTRLISKKSSKQMQTPLSAKENYGLALLESKDLIANQTMIGHTGSAYGLYSNMFFNPKEKFGFIVITNGCIPSYVEEGETLKFSKEVINLLYESFIKK